MSAVDAMTLPLSVIREALTACARGSYQQEAAVGLLVAHDVWPRRGDFLARCVEVDDDGWTRDGTATLASVDWAAARLLAGSALGASSERAVLHLAAAIGDGQLGGFASALDHINLGLLLDAIAHTAGWHEHGITRVVTGGAA